MSAVSVLWKWPYNTIYMVILWAYCVVCVQYTVSCSSWIFTLSFSLSLPPGYISCKFEWTAKTGFVCITPFHHHHHNSNANMHTQIKIKERRKCLNQTAVWLFQVCGKLFASQQKLDVHKPVHGRDRKDSFSCPTCGHACTNWRAYLYHVAKHTTNGGKKHNCQVCLNDMYSNRVVSYGLMRWKQAFFYCQPYPLRNYLIFKTW